MRIGQLAKALSFLNAPLDFPHAGQVLIELLLIVAAKLALHGLRIVHDKIQNGALLHRALIEIALALARLARTKQAFKHKTRIRLGRDWRRLRAP